MNFEDEEYGLQSEATAYTRVGVGGKMSELLTGLETAETKIDKDTSPEDRFIYAVNAIARRMMEEHIANITNKDIDNILDKSRYVTELKYKNPLAYILGYIATNGGQNIEAKQVKYVIKDILPKLGKDSGVEPPDVIRYARYWKNFL